MCWPAGAELPNAFHHLSPFWPRAPCKRTHRPLGQCPVDETHIIVETDCGVGLRWVQSNKDAPAVALCPTTAPPDLFHSWFCRWLCRLLLRRAPRQFHLCRHRWQLRQRELAGTPRQEAALVHSLKEAVHRPAGTNTSQARQARVLPDLAHSVTHFVCGQVCGRHYSAEWRSPSQPSSPHIRA